MHFKTSGYPPPLPLITHVLKHVDLGYLQGLTDFPEMAKETSTSPTSGTGPSMATTNQSRPFLSSGGSDLAPEPWYVTTLGLVPTQPLSCQVDEALMKNINNAKAPYTWNNYSSKWHVFWCQEKYLWF